MKSPTLNLSIPCKLRRCVAPLLVASACLNTMAERIALDPGFNPILTNPGGVAWTFIQPGGKILIVGDFERINGFARNHIARLNQEGTLDSAFLPNWSSDGAPAIVAMQPDGKVLVGTQREQYNAEGQLDTAFHRLNADGTLDTGFEALVSGSVYGVATQSDAKIVIGGFFTQVNGTPRLKIARLNSDGSLDTSFGPVLYPAALAGYPAVAAIAVQPDAKLVIGGSFFSIGGLARTNIARLNDDGSVDQTFDVDRNGIALGSRVGAIQSILLQEDGRILLAGYERPTDEGWRAEIARLNQDGSLDQTFHPGPAACCGLALQPDGRIFYRNSEDGLARLNSDGTVDTTFVTPPEQLFGVPLVQGDGRSIAFTAGGLRRFSPDGRLDSTFAGTILESAGQVKDITVRSDGKILIRGSFAAVNGIARTNFAQLSADGTLDQTFGPVSIIDSYLEYGVTSQVLQPDNKLLLTGAFESVNGVARVNIARLNPDGSLDSKFAPTVGGNRFASCLQPDGKIIIGSEFASVNGMAPTNIARLDESGALDLSFNASVEDTEGQGFAILAIAGQDDGKIVVGGTFTKVNGATKRNIARLNSDGSLDSNFKAVLPYAEYVHAVRLQTDQKIVVAGTFNSVSGISRRGIARLLADGSVDESFDPGSRIDGQVWNIWVQRDGRIVIQGSFQHVDGNLVTGLARLDASGQVEREFIGGPEGALNPSRTITLALQDDGAIILGGAFTQIDGQSHFGLARFVRPRPVLDSYTLTPERTFSMKLTGDANRAYRVEASTELINWQLLTNITAGARPVSVIDPDAAAFRRRFYRVASP